MPVGTRDVALHAGVSQRTVSNVVNGYPHVAPATRAKVQASLDALGYRPNLAARQLRSGRTGTVTLAVPHFGERYFADLSDAFISRAADRGIRVLIETTQGDRDTELRLVNGQESPLTDGLIISALTLGRADLRAPAARFPLVVVGDHGPNGWADFVDIPNRRAARAATQHLMDRGRRRILLLGGSATHTFQSSLLRRRGYLDALRAAGTEPRPELIVDSPWNRGGAEQRVEQLLSGPAPRFDGVVAMTDAVALGALRAFGRHGVRVPDDVAVIGFDGTADARWADPSLSSVAPSLHHIAELALDLIAEQHAVGPGTGDAEGRRPQRRHADFTLVVRESTGD